MERLTFEEYVSRRDGGFVGPHANRPSSTGRACRGGGYIHRDLGEAPVERSRLAYLEAVLKA